MTQKNKAVAWFEKYFWRLAILNVLLFIAACLLFEKSLHYKTVMYILAFLPVIWMGISHDILHYKTVFLRFLGLSITMMALGLWLNYTNGDRSTIFISVGSKVPLYFLLLQKILRYIFVYLWKREPEFRGVCWNLPNNLYMMILSTGTMLLSFSELLLRDF